MKKILVPTDFSKEAENALKVAAQLAKKENSEIYLLHMLELPLQEVDAMSSHSALPEAMFFMKLAHQKFENLMASDYLEGITVHETVKSDTNFGNIIDKCHELNIDLIVMGSHGASGFKEMFVGSNAEKVVRTSDIPVLVIKNEHTSFNVKNFVFASDFKNDNKETYKQATDFASAFGSKIHLLMVNTANTFTTTAKAKERILDFIKDYEFDNYTLNIYNDTTVESGILNFSKDIDADLIGISTHGRQGIAHFFNGSISEDLVNHAKRPVITFKI
ncbi:MULTISPECIES: universal stress protein [Meridianimaribacter]|jgi:nucleotide-binding universal stress UspA family protein|uniref:Nucleotide-binding universal stress UspA family protein n=1 Tax=Meridianimaribacter flavus TaxID=571115 RepID=A0ABY2G3S4_9FLAO|nr:MULTISPECIES: universal stress protein [Meridianimaribacter]RYH73516.1 universal stress protein [Flavobacteriaceae bacterium 144Ye]TBV25236.1 universal stress protein [Meridianimaribacter sp. CL38]TDY10654.1 nucleotide-binding universal stress UspA family protein [Meridianimaribacter flavus]